MSYIQIVTESTLLVDFGLVILIWMVQLIIYPSFVHYTKENLFTWHQKYTNRIAIIVIPLMLSQLVLATVDLFFNLSFISIITFITVLFLWLFTFLGFVPLHAKISEGNANKNLLEVLIRRNWIRTFIWTSLFVFHLFIFLMK